MDAWKNLLDQVVMNFGGIPLIATIFVGAIVLTCSLCCCSALKCNLRHRCCCSFLFRPCYYPSRSFCCKMLRNRCCFCLNLSLFEIGCLFVVVFLHFVWGFFRFDGVQIMEFSARGVNLCFGRLAVLNLILTMFTSHRLSLVRFFFDLGYEDSLAYHKVFGFLMFFWTFLHFLMVLTASIQFSTLELIFGSSSETSHFPIYSNLGGTIGFVGLTILVITSVSSYFRKKKYFVWYVTHISMTVLFFVTVFVHRNEILMLIMLVLAFFTILDFAYRWMYFLCFPSRVTKVEIYKPLKMVKLHVKLPWFFPKYFTGQVVDLYFPKFSPLLSHPYSVCSVYGDLISENEDDGEEDSNEKKKKKKKNNDLLIYIKKRGRFSKNIYKCAKNKSLKRKWVRVCGPFGTPFYSTTKLYKDIVLIGDGVCASGIIFSHLKNLMIHNQKKKEKRVVCFWMIRRLEYLEGFRDELEELYSSGMIRIYFVGDADVLEERANSEEEEEEEKVMKKKKKKKRRRVRYKFSKKKQNLFKYVYNLSTFEIVKMKKEEEEEEESVEMEEIEDDDKQVSLEKEVDDVPQQQEEHEDEEEQEEMEEIEDDDNVSLEKEVDNVPQQQQQEEEEHEDEEECGEEFESIDLESEEVSPVDYCGEISSSSSSSTKEDIDNDDEVIFDKESGVDDDMDDEVVLEDSEKGRKEVQNYKLETVDISVGVPNWRKEFRKLKSRRIGMCVYGSKELVKEVKRNTFLTLGKTFHCYTPIYQM